VDSSTAVCCTHTSPVLTALICAPAMQVNRTIRHLQLSENPLGADGVRALALALPFNNTLKTLGTVQHSYCTHTILLLYSYCTHTVLILYAYCTHTALILYSYSVLLGLAGVMMCEQLELPDAGESMQVQQRV
jgi:hypothetical protein